MGRGVGCRGKSVGGAGVGEVEPNVGVEVIVGVSVGVSVGVFVAVSVGVLVGVSVGVPVAVLVGVLLGVYVAVLVAVFVAVVVGVSVGVFVPQVCHALAQGECLRRADSICSESLLDLRDFGVPRGTVGPGLVPLKPLK